LLAFLGTTLWFNRGLTSYWSGLESARLGDWSSAAEHLCQAAQVNQGKTFYAHQCSLAQAHAAYQHGDDPARLASAVEVERQALTIDPYWYVHWANLASYEWQLGQRQEALEHMRQAAEMAPTQPLLWLNLAWMDEQQGFAWQAARHYRTVLCRNPYYRDTLYFAASPVFQAAAELPCQPEDNLPANDSSAHQLWNAWQALQSGNLDASRQYIQRLAGLHPKNPSPYAYLARFHAASGDLSQADQALKTAFFVYEDSTLVQLAAAVLAQAHGDQASVLEHASRLFELIESSTLSKSYYLPAYLSHALPTDLSPYLKSANLTAESYQLLRDLAEELEAQGNDTRAMRLHRFLNYQSIP
jgi:tetratricopeptide (TPR) repeat protein